MHSILTHHPVQFNSNSGLRHFSLFFQHNLHCSTRLCTMVRYKCIDWFIDWLIDWLNSSTVLYPLPCNRCPVIPDHVPPETCDRPQFLFIRNPVQWLFPSVGAIFQLPTYLSYCPPYNFISHFLLRVVFAVWKKFLSIFSLPLRQTDNSSAL